VRTSVRFVEIDGEEGDDLLMVYGVGDQAAPSEWRIRVEAGTGNAYDTELLVDTSGVALVSAIGGGDIDGDGRDELFTAVGAGAYATIVAIHTVAGCDLPQLVYEGLPVEVPVGASVGNLAGVTCTEDGTLILWDGVADPDGPEGVYDVKGQELALDGSTLSKVADYELNATLGDLDFVYGELSCHGLTVAGPS
jgi:hypothetical protein